MSDTDLRARLLAAEARCAAVDKRCTDHRGDDWLPDSCLWCALDQRDDRLAAARQLVGELREEAKVLSGWHATKQVGIRALGHVDGLRSAADRFARALADGDAGGAGATMLLRVNQAANGQWSVCSDSSRAAVSRWTTLRSGFAFRDDAIEWALAQQWGDVLVNPPFRRADPAPPPAAPGADDGGRDVLPPKVGGGRGTWATETTGDFAKARTFVESLLDAPPDTKPSPPTMLDDATEAVCANCGGSGETYSGLECGCSERCRVCNGTGAAKGNQS